MLSQLTNLVTLSLSVEDMLFGLFVTQITQLSQLRSLHFCILSDCSFHSVYELTNTGLDESNVLTSSFFSQMKFLERLSFQVSERSFGVLTTIAKEIPQDYGTTMHVSLNPGRDWVLDQLSECTSITSLKLTSLVCSLL